MERFFINQQNNNEVTVGGVRVLADFSPVQVIVAVTGAQVVINGERLRISRFDENEICVTGKVLKVETLNKGVRSG